MKVIQNRTDPVNVVVAKDTRRELYIAQFDALQVNPRVSVGSTWVAFDQIYNRRFLMRVVEIGYNEDFDLKQVLPIIRENPKQPFDSRAREYYCSEKVWLHMEGEFVNGNIQMVHDQPTILQTFLRPTTERDDLLIAAPDLKRGFGIGTLRSGSNDRELLVTLDDRFVGFRTLISGASGFGKSTLVRNIARYWLEDTSYGKIIDDLKGEYIGDIKDEKGQTVFGLYNHPDAKNNLYLLTARPRRFEGTGLEEKIAGIIPLNLDIDDIPPENLNDLATHLTAPQQSFIDTYQDMPNLFRILLRKNSDGSPDTSDWYQRFRGWIVLTKQGEKNVTRSDYKQEPSDFMPNSYTPIHGVIRQLSRLEGRPYVNSASSSPSSCLPMVCKLLAQGATIILDKSGLTEGDKRIVSTVLANHLYNHNERYSSGPPSEQANVIDFVYLVEEAHLLLSKEKVKEGSVFVNFAKTGRSFQIGLVAVTQRPSSVDTNILSQFDNFITFRLTNEQDVRDLIQAKSDFQGYEGEIRTVGRGAAIAAFSEPTKVQSVQVFKWTLPRASTRLSEEEKAMMQRARLPEDPQRE